MNGLPNFVRKSRSAENEYENGNSEKENGYAEFCQNAVEGVEANYSGNTAAIIGDYGQIRAIPDVHQFLRWPMIASWSAYFVTSCILMLLT